MSEFIFRHELMVHLLKCASEQVCVTLLKKKKYGKEIASGCVTSKLSVPVKPWLLEIVSNCHKYLSLHYKDTKGQRYRRGECT